MVDKVLVELQKGCKATCAVIKEEDSKELDSKIIINSNVTESELANIIKNNVVDNKELNYIQISNIDEINNDLQNKYYQIVKDREFYGYKIPNDAIIVLTVKEKEGLKNIMQELYNFCVVAF